MKLGRVYRLLRIISLLQEDRGYTATEIAQELDISKRTVFRDLNTLELAHIPYYFDSETGGYHISSHFFLKSLNLTMPEALSLLTLATNFKQDNSFPLLSGEAARAMAKIEGVLPESIQKYVGDVTQAMSVHFAPMAAHDDADATFNMLNKAIAETKVCRVRYDSFFEKKIITESLEPLKLTFIYRAWYLLAYTPSAGEVRTYKLIRIKDIELMDEFFERKHDERLEDYFGNAWAMIPEGKTYKIHLRFQPKVAGNVAEVCWHPSQRVEWNEDGSVDFHVNVDGINEISWWIMGYGDQVRVISPKKLRTKICTMAENIISQYDGKESK